MKKENVEIRCLDKNTQSKRVLTRTTCDQNVSQNLEFLARNKQHKQTKKKRRNNGRVAAVAQETTNTINFKENGNEYSR